MISLKTAAILALSLAAFAPAVPALAAPPDSLTIVLPEEPQSLELCESGTSIRRVTQRNVGEPLVFRDPNTQALNPGLATAWQRIDDTTWRFTLRDGVTFHDGEAFDATAAAQSLNRTWTKELACGVNQQYFQGNTYSAGVVDAKTLEIKTATLDAILPLRLSFLAISAPATPAAEKTSEPIGTGPYKFVEWARGEHITLEKYAGYWGDNPGVEKVEYQWRQESAVRAAMAQTGEADLVLSVASQDVLAADWDSGRAVNFPVPGVALLRFDMVDPLQPINDLRVRKAINLAIDRQGFIDVVFNGLGSPANQVFSSTTIGYDDTIPAWKFDPDEARKLIAEAKADGVATDTEIVIYGRLGVYENATEGMELVASMLKDVGLNVRVEMLALQAWLGILRNTYEPGRATNMMQQSHENVTGDAIFTFNPQYAATGPFSALRDDKLNQMVADAQGLSGDERATALKAISRYLYTEVIPDAPIAVTTSTMMLSDAVTYKPTPASFEEILISDIKAKQ
ncbi:MAG TPA: ABC transporter substrate-binding protein [Devosiaceae bacterium]|jgi:peptide/nickel transport system substrate-binding protein